MIKSLNTVVEKHLESLNLSPALAEIFSEQASLWTLELAPDIEAELFCQIIHKDDITLTFNVSMDLNLRDTHLNEAAINAFVIALALVTVPVGFTATNKVVTLRLVVKTNLQSLNALIAEAIVQTRHFCGPLLLGIVELEQGQRTLPDAIEQTLKRLRESGQAA